MHEDEKAEFWKSKSHEELVGIVAHLHRERRAYLEMAGFNEVMAYRKAIAELFISGTGVEVGAGDRPWPLSSKAKCFYGDIRDSEGLGTYFKNSGISFDGFINAQTFQGVSDCSFDFVISGHVIEHLPDPVGAIRETVRVLRPGGHFLLAVPDMRFTHDAKRPPTSLEHLLGDETDGGAGTAAEAYEEHVRFVHTFYHPPFPEDQISFEVQKISSAGMDIHWHAWTTDTFIAMLHAIHVRLGFEIIAQVSVRNENIFVLKKTG